MGKKSGFRNVDVWAVGFVLIVFAVVSEANHLGMRFTAERGMGLLDRASRAVNFCPPFVHLALARD